MSSKSALVVCVLAVLALVVPSAAKADSLTVQNADFAPGPTLTSCGTNCLDNTGPISDWTYVSNGAPGAGSGSWDLNTTYFNSVPAATGAYVNGGTLSQTLTGVELLPDTTYTLSVYVGYRNDGGATNYDFGLDAGSTQLVSSGWVSNTLLGAGNFALETLTYTTGSTVAPGDLTIFLGDQGIQTTFTDVSLTAVATPEPSSLILLLIGLVGLGLAWKRYGSKWAQPVTVA